MNVEIKHNISNKLTWKFLVLPRKKINIGPCQSYMLDIKYSIFPEFFWYTSWTLDTFSIKLSNKVTIVHVKKIIKLFVAINVLKLKPQPDIVIIFPKNMFDLFIQYNKKCSITNIMTITNLHSSNFTIKIFLVNYLFDFHF